MTPREMAESIVEQNGECFGIDCRICPIRRICRRGDSHSATLFKSKQWLIDNPKTPVKNEGENEGVKHNANKIRYSLIPPECLELLADSLTSGAVEYSDFNWQKRKNPNKTHYDSLMRHLQAWRKGKKMDESGKTHLQCAFANAMFLTWFEIQEIDDD